MLETTACLNQVCELRARHDPSQSLLVGISGIDGSGKGYVAQLLERQLTQLQFRVANLNVDGWLNLPSIRFDTTNPSQRFYDHAIRFTEMFEQLVLPLRSTRHAHLTMDWLDETATTPRPYCYDLHDIDVILLEGIFVFKRPFRALFDFAIWIECSWEVALQRAIRRSQEGLSQNETIAAYETTFFAAQRIHLAHDAPHAAADLILDNDTDCP